MVRISHIRIGGFIMATVVKRNKKYYVVYNYLDAEGNRKQKWESKSTMKEAQSRKKEVEYKEQLGTFTVPSCTTVDELLQEYVDLYGKNTWALSTYPSNVSLIKHYISPVIGQMKLFNVTTRVIEQYYQRMLHFKAVKRAIGTTQLGNVSSTLVQRFLDSAQTNRELLISLVERVELTENKEIIIKFRFSELSKVS